ncbi:hypothetical protein Pint_09999 [Pistacia integerrima]|uniref:Uncharacterized protein n=1 Tax=Pistacia integerrima TaxID=434235 RepID=A0ACC0XLJ5_9ROSI|nr:hypothetical protein Pint_09999 [Pistacia integerrima]
MDIGGVCLESSML